MKEADRRIITRLDCIAQDAYRHYCACESAKESVAESLGYTLKDLESSGIHVERPGSRPAIAAIDVLSTNRIQDIAAEIADMSNPHIADDVADLLRLRLGSLDQSKPLN